MGRKTTTVKENHNKGIREEGERGNIYRKTVGVKRKKYFLIWVDTSKRDNLSQEKGGKMQTLEEDIGLYHQRKGSNGSGKKRGDHQPGTESRPSTILRVSKGGGNPKSHP